MGGLEFDVLGPLAVRRDGRPVPIGGGKRALLLAVLLSDPGRPATRGNLIEELWGDNPPETAVTALHGLVSQLRRLLEDEEALRDGSWQVLFGRGSGYGISAADGAIDAQRFFAHAEHARNACDRGDHAVALAATDAALALWRGHPVLGLETPGLAAFAARCEDARVDALEDRADALLGLGRPREALTVVEPLIDDHPRRERLRAAQAVALYRSGRQTDALAALAAARNRLRGELGLEPSPLLGDLERRILNHDPELGPASSRADAPRRQPSRLRLAIALVGTLTVVAAGAAALIGSRHGGSPNPAVAAPGDRAVAIDAASGAIRAAYPVGAGAVALASDDDAVWTLNADDSTVTRIDLRSRVTRTFGTGTTPIDLAAGDGALWVADGSRSDAQFVGPVVTAVSKLDTRNGAILVTTGLQRSRKLTSNVSRQHIAVTPDAIFVVGADFAVSRLNPATVRITARSSGVLATAIAAGGLGIWALEPTGLVQLDPTSLRVLDRVPLAGANLDRLAVGANSIWVTDSAAGALWRVDTSGVNAVAHTVDVDPGIDAVAVAGGSVWVTDPEHDQLIRIDPDRDAVTKRIPLGGPPLGILAAGRLLWVSVGARAAPAGDALGQSCGPLFYGGPGRPDEIIVSDLPMGASPRLPARQMADAIRFVLRARRYRAGSHTIGYRACDDYSGATSVFDPSRCRANGQAYARDRSVVAVVGPYNSDCALALIPPTNAAPGGPLAVISPTATFTGLTRRGMTTPKALPEALYPAGTRSFSRLLASEDAEGAALAQEARALSAERVDVVTGSSYDKRISDPFEAAARRLGIVVRGSYLFDPAASDYAPLAERIARDHPDAVLVSGLIDENAGGVVRSLRRRLGPGVALIGSEALLPVSALFASAGTAARGVHIALPGLETGRLGAAGSAFIRAFGAIQQGPVEQASVYAAAATELALDAIAHSDGTRAGVLAAVARPHPAGILGRLRLDARGDVRPATFTIVQAVHPGGSHAVGSTDGSVWERLLTS